MPKRLPNTNYLFAGMFGLLPILMILFALWVAGTTTLHCQRVEPQQVNCTLATVRWLGRGARQELPLTHVQTAYVHSYSCEREERINGKTERVSQTCRELAIRSKEGEIRPGFSAELVPGFNAFLDSTHREWSVETSSWSFALGLLGFAGVWTGVGWLFFRERPLFKQK